MSIREQSEDQVTDRQPKNRIKTLCHDPKDHSLSLVQHDAPDPSTLPGSLLIKVHAAALCAGELLWPEPATLAHPVPGFDLSGTVLSLPTPPDPSAPSSASCPFKIGDRVYGMTPPDRPGSARELTLALPRELAPAPRNASWVEAAAAPLSALTAWQALFVHAGLRAPDVGVGVRGAATPDPGSVVAGRRAAETRPVRVLVTAGSGGVGTWAVQLASLSSGAAGVGSGEGVVHVTATCGPRNRDLVAALGADEVLDYVAMPDLRAWVDGDRPGREFDVVLDCVGGEVLEQAWACVKGDGGFLTSVTLTPADEPVSVPDGIVLAGRSTGGAGLVDAGKRRGVRTKFFIVEPDARQLAAITALIEQGKVRPVVDSVYDLQDYAKAFERVGGGHARGKVVLSVSE